MLVPKFKVIDLKFIGELTTYGRLVRSYRIKYSILLKDHAEYLRVSPAYLSGTEVGRHELTEDIVERTIQMFKEKHRIVAADLREAFQNEKTT